MSALEKIMVDFYSYTTKNSTPNSHGEVELYANLFLKEINLAVDFGVSLSAIDKYLSNYYVQKMSSEGDLNYLASQVILKLKDNAPGLSTLLKMQRPYAEKYMLEGDLDTKERSAVQKI